MANQFYDKNALTLLKGRVACKLAEINQMLAPGVLEPISADALQAEAIAYMNSLPPAAQERLRLKALVAYAELERLSDDLARKLQVLTEEMQKVTRRNRATLAYRQTPRPARLGLAGL